MTPGAVLLLVVAQAAQTMTPAEWSGETRPADVRDVRCPERVAPADCAQLTSVVVSLTKTSVNRRKFRELFGGATVDVEIREKVVELTASVAPARMTAVLDSPLRLQWDVQSSNFMVSGFRLRAVFDALQEFLAGVAPELTGKGFTAFERGGLVSLNIRSGSSHLQIAVDRNGKRLFLGAASWPEGQAAPAPTPAVVPVPPVAPPVVPMPAPATSVLPAPLASPKPAAVNAPRQNPY